ncbi:Hypothetical protein PHPALM_8999 [Phytophthora palmivora]|uniref:Uncharacterized protein n=1 Tax=Phytophthora palmivora TaxID=4796 RepID=A0A2P4Y8F7_9STRA|nr:Hypothetical protein PHPALM_8999 [Phytophthora palmivora]
MAKRRALGFGCLHAADETMSVLASKGVAASADPVGQPAKRVTRLKDYADVWTTEMLKLKWWKLILDARVRESLAALPFNCQTLVMKGVQSAAKLRGLRMRETFTQILKLASVVQAVCQSFLIICKCNSGVLAPLTRYIISTLAEGGERGGSGITLPDFLLQVADSPLLVTVSALQVSVITCKRLVGFQAFH